jgi:hypothetical protein
MINRLVETNQAVEVQETTFAIDVLGRYVCNTWDEAVNNGGVAFDAVVIGAGMFGAYCAEKIYRRSNLRVLVLVAGSFLVSEHVQNFARVGLNSAGAIQVVSKTAKTQAHANAFGALLGAAKSLSRPRLLSWRKIALLGRLVTAANAG